MSEQFLDIDIDKAIDLAKDGYYQKSLRNHVIKEDYIRTLQDNKGAVNKTIEEISYRYDMSMSQIKFIVRIC